MTDPNDPATQAAPPPPPPAATPGPPPPPAAPGPPPAWGAPAAWGSPAPDPSGGQAGWATPAWQPAQPRPRRSRRPWVIGCVLLLVLLIVGVGACTVFFARSFVAAGSVIGASHGQIEGFNSQSFNGSMRIVFTAAPGVDAATGHRLGCEVVGPTLAGTDSAGAEWVLVDRAGDVLATNQTPCP